MFYQEYLKDLTAKVDGFIIVVTSFWGFALERSLKQEGPCLGYRPDHLGRLKALCVKLSRKYLESMTKTVGKR